MCGIFGWAPSAPYGKQATPQLAETLVQSLAHRGPDDRGFVAFAHDGSLLGTEREHSALGQRDCALLLGHTRLSIIDLSTAGHQPMRSPDGRYTLVYNGEIYNYLELRRELESQGRVFQSHTDSEVLLQALIHWGKACLTRFTGMFAFAFYDREAKTLFCGRDFFGIKPFYYQAGANGFAFASELPALLQVPGVSRALSAQNVYNYLRFAQYDIGESSFFADIFQLPPGHCLTLHLDAAGHSVGEARPERYWKPDLEQRSRLSFAEAAEALRGLFLDSVRLHLRSDVPLGVALSGGIDSSAVTCAVRYLQPDTELHTFSFIAKNTPVSEEHWANLVAGHTKAIRHTVEVAPEELTRDLDHMILRLGEPFGSTSIYAQYRVFKLARDCGVKVTLDGQGADELLAGYFGYPGQRMASLLLRGDLAGAWRFMRAKSTWPDSSAKAILRSTIREFTPRWLVPLGFKLVGSEAAPPWLDVGALHERGVRFVTRDDRARLYPQRERVRQVLAYQLTWEGLPQLLRHGDRNAMAFSIESRVPFLTREMAEFCLSLPEEYLIDMNGCSKSVFRAAMRGIVPDAILDRRDKIGFATPEQEWLNALSPWVEETFGAAKNIPYMNMDEIRKAWRAVREGKARFDWRVWRWLNYVRWVQLLNLEA